MPARANHGGGNHPSLASQRPQVELPTDRPESAALEEPEQKVAMAPAKPTPPRVDHPDSYLLTDIPCISTRQGMLV